MINSDNNYIIFYAIIQLFPRIFLIVMEYFYKVTPCSAYSVGYPIILKEKRA